ncbi:unnamed protein product [Mytilus coruscus]|uniref:Uncharacterized protein n=1 Tax=Mytilus coruscus TaxID=42192 RepID=A0A6J8BYT6_MYTCO|nr:unnamed protein product [Mytilus coruscus]
MLKSAIQFSQFKRDVVFNKNSVTCLQCKVSISTESSNHFSNVLRHFNSESHIFKTQWCVKDDSVKNILSVVSLKQKSTLLTFFGGTMKDKNTQVPNIPISVSNTKLQCEIDRESEHNIKELQLKEKLLQQNTEMNKWKANELCYVFQNDYQENKKDEGNDMQNMRFYMQTLVSKIDKHITCKEDSMLNEIETEKTILSQIEKFRYQQISYTVNAIEMSDDLKNINLKFLQDFICDKLATFSSILDKKRFFQERFTTTELIKSLEKKGPDPNSSDTDVYIKFSVLL